VCFSRFGTITHGDSPTPDFEGLFPGKTPPWRSQSTCLQQFPRSKLEPCLRFLAREPYFLIFVLICAYRVYVNQNQFNRFYSLHSPVKNPAANVTESEPQKPQSEKATQFQGIPPKKWGIVVVAVCLSDR
jgi:hypothetical protein